MFDFMVSPEDAPRAVGEHEAAELAAHGGGAVPEHGQDLRGGRPGLFCAPLAWVELVCVPGVLKAPEAVSYAPFCVVGVERCEGVIP